MDLTVVYDDAISWLKKFKKERSANSIAESSTLIYLDPPYPNTTRKSNTKYAFDMIDSQHEALLKIIVSLDCMVQISSYENALYNRYLKSWHRHEFITYDRANNECKEIIYFNYPEPDELHTWDYVGSDYRQRENIKRKIKRYVEKFSKMENLERKAILREISQI